MLNLVLWAQDRCSLSSFGLKVDVHSHALGPIWMLNLVLWAQRWCSLSSGTFPCLLARKRPGNVLETAGNDVAAPGRLDGPGEFVGLINLPRD